MPQTCILTDSTAQFQTPQFIGNEHIYCLPLRVQIDSQTQPILSVKLPPSIINGLKPKLLPPNIKAVQTILHQLSQRYHEIVAVLPSRHLSPSYKYITQVIESETIPKTFLRAIDTQTTSIGLGLLVQVAAQAAENDLCAAEIIRQIRDMVQRVYTVFFTRSLTYLYRAGFLDAGQAIVGEMFKVAPLYLIDGNRPICLQKAHNTRQMANGLLEFIQEFNQLEHIGIVRHPQVFTPVVKSILEKLPRGFPHTPFSIHQLEPTLGTILGPSSLGLIALEARE